MCSVCKWYLFPMFLILKLQKQSFGQSKKKSQPEAGLASLLKPKITIWNNTSVLKDRLWGFESAGVECRGWLAARSSSALFIGKYLRVALIETRVEKIGSEKTSAGWPSLTFWRIWLKATEASTAAAASDLASSGPSHSKQRCVASC